MQLLQEGGVLVVACCPPILAPMQALPLRAVMGDTRDMRLRSEWAIHPLGELRHRGCVCTFVRRMTQLRRLGTENAKSRQL